MRTGSGAKYLEKRQSRCPCPTVIRMPDQRYERILGEEISADRTVRYFRRDMAGLTAPLSDSAGRAAEHIRKMKAEITDTCRKKRRKSGKDKSALKHTVKPSDFYIQMFSADSSLSSMAFSSPMLFRRSFFSEVTGRLRKLRFCLFSYGRQKPLVCVPKAEPGNENFYQ